MAAANTGTINIRVNLQNAVQQLQKLNTTLQNVDSKASTTNRKLAGLSTSLQAQTKHLRAISEAVARANRSFDAMNTSLSALIGWQRQSAQNQQLQIRALEQTSVSVSMLVSQMQRLQRIQIQQLQTLNQLATGHNQAGHAVQAHSTSIKGLNSQLLGLIASFGVATSAVDIFKSSLDITKEFDSITKTFYAITGSMAGANQEMNYVRQTAEGFGLDLMTVAKTYKSFSAAMKYGNMEMTETKEIYESVAGAATVLGLSAQKQELVFMALEQMVSKGVVSMEELRRQLGDQLPGAFELGAKAMNMGLAEFNKFVASGQLMTEDFLPRFAKTLKETYATAENIGLALKTPRAELQKFFNELVIMRDTFARQGFLDTVIEAVRELTEAMRDQETKQNVIELGRSFGVLVSAGAEVLKFLAKHTTAVKNIIIVYGSYRLAMFAITVILPKLVTAYGAWTIALSRNNTTMQASLTNLTRLRANFANFLPIIATAGGVLTAIGVGLSLIVPMFMDLGKNIDYSREFADKFGVSANEANAQLAMFLKTAGETDPLAQLNKQLGELTERLANIRYTADIGFEGVMKQMRKAFAEVTDIQFTGSVDYEEGGLSDINTIYAPPEIINKEEVAKDLTYVEDMFKQTFELIQNGSLSSGKSVAVYMQQIEQSLKQNALSTKEAWTPVLNYLKQVALAQADVLEAQFNNRLQQQITDLNNSWMEHVELTDEVKKSLEAVGAAMNRTAKFGADMAQDMKSMEAVMKLVDTYYAKSEEGIQKQYENTLAQIDNAENVAKAWAATSKLKLECEKAERISQIKTTEAMIKQAEVRIATAENESAAVVESIKAQIQAYKTLLVAQQASVEGIDAQMAAIDARVKEVIERTPQARLAAIAEMEKKMKKNGVGSGGGKPKKTKSGGGGGAAKRDQNSLNSFTNEVQKAQDALQNLEMKHTELMAKLQGESYATQIGKLNRQAVTETNKLDQSYAKLQQRFQQMAAGPQKEAAKQELQTVKELIDKQKERIQQNTEIEIQLVKIQQQITKLSESAEIAKNNGDYTKYWAEMQAKLNAELERMPEGTAGRAAKEQEARIAQMRKEWDLLGLASVRMNQWVIDTAISAQDSFADIIPNALDKTISAFSTMFTDILWGTKKSEDAWTAFCETISNMGKMIIQTLIEVALKMMIVKSFSIMGGLFAADGAVVDGGSVATAANGRVVSGPKPIAFASGGVLGGPTLFSTTNGQPIIAGEAGPEAFVPLGRTREGKLGIETTGSGGTGGGQTVMIVNVYNNVSDQVQTRQEQGQDQNGMPKLDIFIDQIDAALGKRIGQGRSSIGRAIDKTRGTSSSKSLYS